MGHLLNTNADTIASSLAVALSPFFQVRLLYCFEKKGVLLSVEDENSVVPKITRERFEAMKADGSLHSGMIPKIENALLAIEKGVKGVVIGHAGDLIENVSEEIKSSPKPWPHTAPLAVSRSYSAVVFCRRPFGSVSLGKVITKRRS